MKRDDFWAGALVRGRVEAFAELRGDAAHPALRGTVRFWQSRWGAVAVAEVRGLPTPTGACSAPIFGFHIHGGGACGGDAEDPFRDAGTHYNPGDCPHPYHAGDLPPLFGAGGYAFSAFLTDRFSVDEILGKTVVIHSAPDDFTSQPAGNAGTRIACGVIRRVQER